MIFKMLAFIIKSILSLYYVNFFKYEKKLSFTLNTRNNEGLMLYLFQIMGRKRERYSNRPSPLVPILKCKTQPLHIFKRKNIMKKERAFSYYSLHFEKLHSFFFILLVLIECQKT